MIQQRIIDVFLSKPVSIIIFFYQIYTVFNFGNIRRNSQRSRPRFFKRFTLGVLLHTKHWEMQLQNGLFLYSRLMHSIYLTLRKKSIENISSSTLDFNLRYLYNNHWTKETIKSLFLWCKTGIDETRNDLKYLNWNWDHFY